mgnify:CR=1 FL=1
MTVGCPIRLFLSRNVSSEFCAEKSGTASWELGIVPKYSWLSSNSVFVSTPESREIGLDESVFFVGSEDEQAKRSGT